MDDRAGKGRDRWNLLCQHSIPPDHDSSEHIRSLVQSNVINACPVWNTISCLFNFPLLSRVVSTKENGLHPCCNSSFSYKRHSSSDVSNEF